MSTTHITLEGVKPILWHHFSRSALEPGNKEPGRSPGNNPDKRRATVLATRRAALSGWQLHLQLHAPSG